MKENRWQLSRKHTKRMFPFLIYYGIYKEKNIHTVWQVITSWLHYNTVPHGTSMQQLLRSVYWSSKIQTIFESRYGVQEVFNIYHSILITLFPQISWHTSYGNLFWNCQWIIYEDNYTKKKKSSVKVQFKYKLILQQANFTVVKTTSCHRCMLHYAYHCIRWCITWISLTLKYINCSK